MVKHPDKPKWPPPLSKALVDLATPLSWYQVDRSFVVQLFLIVGMTAAGLRAAYLLLHPEIEPYFHRPTLALLVLYIFGFVVLETVLGAVGLQMRRRRSNMRRYLHTVSLSWWITFTFIAYLHGPFTTPMWIFFPFLGLGSILLFETPIVVTGVVTSLAGLFATTLAERLGYLPYAPLFVGAPEEHGRLSDAWVWSNMIWPPVLSLNVMLGFHVILTHARAQAAQLATLAHSSGASRERNRIARDLHDDVASRLLTLRHRAPTPADAELAGIALRALRDVIRGLDDSRVIALADALAEWRADLRDRAEAAGLRFDWRQNEEPQLTYLDARQRLNLARVLSEAASNVFRHADATKMLVTVRLDAAAGAITVSDDGKARAPETWRLGHGLRSITERAVEIGGHARYFANRPDVLPGFDRGLSVEITFPTAGSPPASGTSPAAVPA